MGNLISQLDTDKARISTEWLILWQGLHLAGVPIQKVTIFSVWMKAGGACTEVNLKNVFNALCMSFPVLKEAIKQAVSTNVLTHQGTPLWQMPKLVHQMYIEKAIVGWQGPDTQWNLQHTGQEWEGCPIQMRSLWHLWSWKIEKPGVTTSRLSILIWVLWHPKNEIKRNDPLLEE